VAYLFGRFNCGGERVLILARARIIPLNHLVTYGGSAKKSINAFSYRPKSEQRADCHESPGNGWGRLCRVPHLRGTDAGGARVVIFDNLCNSHRAVIGRITRIAGRTPEFAQADVRDSDALRDVFSRHRFDAVIHFAGLKAVGESVQKPIEYYDNNVQGALTLCRAMAEAGVGMLVFLLVGDGLRRSLLGADPRRRAARSHQLLRSLETDGRADFGRSRGLRSHSLAQLPCCGTSIPRVLTRAD